MRDVRQSLRLLHYWWPVAMGGSIVMVVHRATGRPIEIAGLGLLCCGILSAYSLDRIVDVSRDQESRWLQRALYGAAGVSMIVGAVLLARLPIRTGLLVPALGVVVLAYPRLKAVPVLKTLLVSVAWTWSLIALPFADGSWLGWRIWMMPVAIPITCVIASGCLLCDLKDVEADQASSVSSLPALMGVRNTVAIAIALALVGSAVALAEWRLGLFVGGLGLGLVALRPKLLAREIVGPLLVDAILTVPGLLIVLHVV